MILSGCGPGTKQGEEFRLLAFLFGELKWGKGYAYL